jgi:hypothetical protein
LREQCFDPSAMQTHAVSITDISRLHPERDGLPNFDGNRVTVILLH